MKEINAEIIADSINKQGDRITTFILTYPRFIHAELLTHRMFSRNSASSRAIPFEKMLKMVGEDPFIPLAWQIEHKGMQGSTYITDQKLIDFKRGVWINALQKIIKSATELNGEVSRLTSADAIPEILNNSSVTKQLCNRLLEPFMWHTVLVTATHFENFFNLRCPQYYYEPENTYFRSKKDWNKKWIECFDDKLPYTPEEKDMFFLNITKSQAEIHIQALAESMFDAINESKPKVLESGQWHIPFGDRIDLSEFDKSAGAPGSGTIATVNIPENHVKIASARAARLSYITHEGEIDYVKDIKLHDQLLNDMHLSPFEHCAITMSDFEYEDFYKGDLKESKEEFCFKNQGWCNNFKGFIPYRYLIENKL